MQTKKVKLAAGRVRYYFYPLFNSVFSLIVNKYGNKTLREHIFGHQCTICIYMKFFMCIKINRDV